jgi:DNA-binding response OmpR family regulator
MTITPRSAEPAEGNWPAQQSPDVGSPLLGLPSRARANITFIAAAPDLFGPYVSYLQDDGYAVSLAADVREASTQAEALCPDLVFLDLGRSSQAGLAMVRALKADPCLGAIPLVMLASFDSLDDIDAGLNLGACDYIIKTETSAPALARGVPAWARIDRQLQAGLQESTTNKRVSAQGAELAFWARPRLPAVQT